MIYTTKHSVDILTWLNFHP